MPCAACRDAESDVGAQVAVDACAIDDVAGCELVLGGRDISVLIDAEVVITNKSVTSPLTVHDVSLIGEPAFRLVDLPSVVAPRESETIVVSVRPNVEATHETKLVIVSDATNAEQAEDGTSLVNVGVRVQGVNNGIPDIVLDTTECAFDVDTTSCAVLVANPGNRALTIDEVRIECDTGDCPFTLAGNATTIAAIDGATSLEVTYEPTGGAHEASLLIASSDPDEAQLSVRLFAQ